MTYTRDSPNTIRRGERNSLRLPAVWRRRRSAAAFPAALPLLVLLPLGEQPGRGQGFLGTTSSAQGRCRSTHLKADHGSPARGSHRIPACARRTICGVKEYHSADPGRQWQSGCHDSDDQFLHACAGYSQCAVNHLPGFRPRIAVSVSRPVPVTCTHVSRQVIEMILEKQHDTFLLVTFQRK